MATADNGNADNVGPLEANSSTPLMRLNSNEYLISATSDLAVKRGCNICDLAEKMDDFFLYQLVVINDKFLDRLDKVQYNREDLTFLYKVEDKQQWKFMNTATNDLYTVFTPEAHEYLTNVRVNELIMAKEMVYVGPTSDEDFDEEEGIGITDDAGNAIFTDGWEDADSDGSSHPSNAEENTSPCSDPNCSGCKQQESSKAKMTGMTMVLPPSDVGTVMESNY